MEREQVETERQRLAAVARYEILDSPPDGAFDRISALAARLFQVPIGIVSIVDRDRIWFKSHHGIEVEQIDREDGLCASAILQDELWLVTDAQIDPRTLANPLVAGEMGLRFYAGVPLTTHDGHNLGTLCVLGQQPREVTEDEVNVLRDLAAIVMDELELRLSARKTVDLEAELRRNAEDQANSLLARYAAQEAASHEVAERRARIAGTLRRDDITMVLQPIMDLETLQVVGMEALARFPGTSQPPNEWFADAASVGLGLELELAAVRAALLQIDRLPPGAYLAINASPATIVSPELQELLLAAPGGRILLELTEHAHVPSYQELSDALAPLRAVGVRLAVDDAGAGFASLQHILNLRPDTIKLDTSLTSGINVDPARRALATALLIFGWDISAEIVAEGIETAEELETLRALGVPYGQGYYLGRPGPYPPVSAEAPSAVARRPVRDSVTAVSE
ncbi:MAG: EAL domain-containing protein [Sporichthyaceae bacterium]|nr:EAL domain-containing protein [Sporichthyaceae bacterium]